MTRSETKPLAARPSVPHSSQDPYKWDLTLSRHHFVGCNASGAAHYRQKGRLFALTGIVHLASFQLWAPRLEHDIRGASNRPVITNNNVTLTPTFVPRLKQLLVSCALTAASAGCVSESVAQ